MADKGSGRGLSFVLAFSLLLGVAFQVGRTYRFAETDLWWNLASGREILAHHALPRRDSYAFTPTLPEWHNHEWLTQIVWITAWGIFGPQGIIALKTLLVVLTFLLCAAAALRRGAGPLAVSFFIILTSIGFYPATSIRPQIFSYLFYAWFLYLFSSPYEGEGQGEGKNLFACSWRWTVALISIPLWVGFHGGFVVGLAALSVFAIARLADVGWRGGKPLILFAGACWIMTLVNPYGIGHWKFLWEAMGHDRSMFPEWSPVTAEWRRQWPFFLAVLVSLYSIVFSRLRKSWAEISLLIFTALIGFLRVRLAPFFIVSAWVFVPGYFESALYRSFSRLRSSLKIIAVTFSFSLVLYGLACVFYSIDHDAFQWDWRLKVAGRDDPWHVGFPVDVVQYMRREGLGGNVACPLAWGGFLIWELPERVRVSLDGRWDTVYPQEVIQEGVDFTNGIHWQAYLDKYRPNIVLAFKGSTLDQGLSTLPAWSRRFEGVEGVLFVRKPVS